MPFLCLRETRHQGFGIDPDVQWAAQAHDYLALDRLADSALNFQVMQLLDR